MAADPRAPSGGAILGCQMPVYTGIALAAVIKGDPLVRDMTVIMLTSRTARAD